MKHSVPINTSHIQVSPQVVRRPAEPPGSPPSIPTAPPRETDHTHSPHHPVTLPFVRQKTHDMHHMFMFTVCCCSLFPPQQDKGEDTAGGLTCPTRPAPTNQPPTPSRNTHRWHVIARHWLRQARSRTSGAIPVTTRTTTTRKNM